MSHSPKRDDSQARKNRGKIRYGKSSWKRNLPDFLDASSSVSIGPFGARRLPELKALHNAVSKKQMLNHIDGALLSGGRSTSSRHLRRRTVSFNSRKRHRFPAGYMKNETTKSIVKNSQNRKSRRKRPHLRIIHSDWQRVDACAKQSSVKKSAVYWLPTHLWHAKRFHMSSSEFFGWKIPLQHASRGPEAVNRLLNENRTTVQDVSWCRQPLVLKDNLEALIKYLYRLCPTSLAVQVKIGESFGELVLHEPDSFPCKAIGPAKVWFRHSDRCKREEPSQKAELYVFVHPSAKRQVQKSLESIVSDAKILKFQADGGLACFECRGISTKALLHRAFDCNFDTKCYHGGITVSIVSGSKNELANRLQHENDHEQHPSSCILQHNEIMLVHHELSTHDSDTSASRSIYHGWDLYCASYNAHNIFMKLVTQPEAITIGCIEAFHTFPHENYQSFPWSYPDSEQGRLFWNGCDGDCNNWKEYRLALESCGRFKEKTFSRSLVTKHIPNVLKQLESITGIGEPSSDDVRVAVVRGSFGQPFVDILQQCGRLLETSRVDTQRSKHENKHGRLRRRQKKTKQQIMLSCPSSKEDSDVRRTKAASLERSLSLPALLRCQIRVVGRGSVYQGDSLYAYELLRDRKTKHQWKDQLGVIVFDGSFDTSMGQVYGIGFVGARCLLKYLSSCQNAAVMIQNGRIELLVNIVGNKGNSSFHGTLSLVL